MLVLFVSFKQSITITPFQNLARQDQWRNKLIKSIFSRQQWERNSCHEQQGEKCINLTTKFVSCVLVYIIIVGAARKAKLLCTYLKLTHFWYLFQQVIVKSQMKWVQLDFMLMLMEQVHNPLSCSRSGLPYILISAYIHYPPTYTW